MPRFQDRGDGRPDNREKTAVRPLHDQVIDVHGNQVDADRVIFFQFGGDLDFGPHAVGAGDEDRLLVIAGEESFIVVQAEQARESAMFTQHARGMGALAEVADAIDHRIASVNINAGGFVCEGCGGIMGHGGSISIKAASVRRVLSQQQPEGQLSLLPLDPAPLNL